MVQLYLVPQWFFGYDIALELLFALVTLAVGLYSLQIYRLSALRECRVLGAGFIFMSLGYFTWSFLNLYVSSVFNTERFVFSLERLTYLGTLGVYVHVLFILLGLATLAYMTLGSRKQRTYVLVTSLSLIVFIFAANKALAFYFVSSLLLLVVATHYWVVYTTRRHSGTLITLLAFVFIFLGNVDFIFATLHNVHYVVGHVLHLIGYLLVLMGLILTVRSS